MIIGALGYKLVGYISFLSPILIFSMLLLTFSKVSFKELHLSLSHLWLILIEVGVAVLMFYIIAPFNLLVAEAVMVCIICPTATAAAVVTGKLHGNIASITTYTLICNIVVAFAIPALFPIMAPMDNQPTFWQAFAHIIKKIFPLLICPFLLAQVIRYFFPKFNAKMASISGLSFYLWAFALVIAMGLAIGSFLEEPVNIYVVISIALGSMFACAMQFFLGKLIGIKYNDTIATGQSLGQKNTVLAIWLCHSYLNPISSIGPGFYIVWQNIFNSWQLYREEKQTKKSSI